MIPRILHRVVGATLTEEHEQFWKLAGELHPDWEQITHADPLVRSEWPETSTAWNLTVSGGQFASLVRLEALWRWGGVYLDQDVECYRPFDELLGVAGFVAWEDQGNIPDAVMGFEAGHPALREAMDLAIERLHRPIRPAPIDQVIDTSVRVSTAVFRDRSDVLKLPPGSLYPYHYTDKIERRWWDHHTDQPWAFCAHHWAATSWNEGEMASWLERGPLSWT